MTTPYRLRARPGAARELDLAADAFRSIDRRTFLRLVGVAAAAGMLPTGCGSAPAPLRPPVDAPLAVLDERGYAVLTAAASRLVGGEGGVWILEGRARPALAADGWLARSPSVAEALSRGLQVLEFGFFPLLPKIRPFTALPPEGQDAVLRALASSRSAWKRDLFRGLKSLTAATFYGDPVARSLTHHPGPFGGPEVGIADAMTYELEV